MEEVLLFVYRRTNEICANPYLEPHTAGSEAFMNPLFRAELPSAQPNPSFGVPGSVVFILFGRRLIFFQTHTKREHLHTNFETGSVSYERPFRIGCNFSTQGWRRTAKKTNAPLNVDESNSSYLNRYIYSSIC